MKLKRGFVLSQEVLPLYLVRLDPPAAPQLPTLRVRALKTAADPGWNPINTQPPWWGGHAWRVRP